jgi:hypothetical protein
MAAGAAAGPGTAVAEAVEAADVEATGEDK